MNIELLDSIYERYGYEVKNVYGHADVENSVALERLLALQTLINV